MNEEVQKQIEKVRAKVDKYYEKKYYRCLSDGKL